jgi:hypothetical protein
MSEFHIHIKEHIKLQNYVLLGTHVSLLFPVIRTVVELQQAPHALLSAGPLPWHFFKGDWCEIKSSHLI